MSQFFDLILGGGHITFMMSIYFFRALRFSMIDIASNQTPIDTLALLQ